MRHFALIFIIVMFAMPVNLAWAQDKPAPKPTSASKPAPAQTPARRPAKPDRAVHVRVTGNIGRTSFTASKSFDAVLGTSRGVTYGGGAGVIIKKNLFVDVDATRFTHSGERVIIGPDNKPFRLGIPLRVTTMPVDVSAGWRAPVGGSQRRYKSIHDYEVAPFIGGGVGVLQYNESSRFDEPGDAVRKTFRSYHVLVGADGPIYGGLGVSLDAVYRWVPGAIGDAGVSRTFNEKDLGGLTLRLRAMFTF